ncbi:uncharacterized protein YjbI with pentapeptide repeats [Azospirillum fermentarium]|uniref:DUF2169 family type VI secretion system accessory protein n=1 Tax=Azospirillum fermentarium TaxID=1233114 RepID=UPI002226EFCC|nr:DUF2169 domain-containing protein [Azospirillum fermentarium]MCW2248037.1 uncharacterized protein YjbI with pentapeptide repeats [Azospirillum fermentarium]
MQIVKPMRLGVLSKPFTHRGRHWLSVAALAYFDFARPDRLLLDSAMWPEVMTVLGGDALLDIAMPKPHAEVLVGGSAHPAPGTPGTVAEPCLRIGPVDKRLIVFGDRSWNPVPGPRRAMATAPLPFTAMPLTWANAFGGPAFADNPVGKGHNAIDRVMAGEAPVPLPNVENPADLIASPRDTPVPAGFGPRDIAWPQRQRLAGTYDAEWLEKDFPGLAADIDWRIFNAAPPDQWLPGYLEPGTPFTVAAMHPEKPVQTGRTPAIRVRVFVRRRGPDGGEQFIEGGTRVDTLWLFPGLSRGVTLHRAGVEIGDSDGLDVEALLLAWERADDPPRPIDYYREILDLRLDPEQGGLYALSDGQLSPPRSVEEEAALAAEREAALDAMVARIEAMRRKALEQVKDKMPADHPIDLPPIDRNSFGPVVTPTQVAEFDIDLKAIIDHAKAKVENVAALRDEALAKAEQHREEAAAIAKTLGHIPETLEERKRKARETAAWQPAALRPPAHPEASGPSFFLNSLKLDPDILAQAETEIPDPAEREEEVMAGFAGVRRIAPSAIAPEEPWFDGVGEDLAGYIRELLDQGHTLAGRDLAGARLAGMDFSGADLRGVMLEKADLTGCRFDGANLEQAVFTEAVLDGAGFAGAVMAGCNLSAVRGAGARFAGADLTRAIMMRASLPGADLSRCTLTGMLAIDADLTAADLTGAVFDTTAWVKPRMADARMAGVTLTLSALVQADLSRADMSGARIERVGLPDLTAPGLSLRGAHIRAISTSSKADLRGADLSWCDADGTSWYKCSLAGARLTGARLDDTVFTQADLRGADLSGASLRGAHFTAADACTATLAGADGFNAVFRKTLLSDAAVTDANMFSAMLDEANLEGAKLDRTNFGLTLFTRRKTW